MKKFILLSFVLLSLTSCEALLNNLNKNRDDQHISTGTVYNSNQHDNHYYNNGYNNGYNTSGQHVTQNTGSNAPGQHVTQTGNNATGYYTNPNQGPGNHHNGQPNYNNHNGQVNHNDRWDDTRRPVVGDIVQSLPDRNVKTVTVNGEKLYLYQGIYYKAIRTNSGTAYKVVGHQN